MRHTVFLASLLAFGVGAAFAQSGPIEQRKAEMKAMGGAAGAMGKMLKGEEAFDLAKVKTGLDVIARNAKSGPALFPAGSDKGDTKAQPAVWADKAKFDGLFAKLAADSITAGLAIKDEASFKAEAGKVLSNCGACHKEYRAQ
jgi:cytochrome c556